MPSIVLRNGSSLNSVANEVKTGVKASGACDPSLMYFGVFRLAPGESVTVVNVSETHDVYWKNVNEYNWTHCVAWNFDDETLLDASQSENGDVPVDVCKQSV